jgi:hypothetical protein
MAEIKDLSVTDASNTARFPENQAASTLNDGARALEGMLARGLKDTVDGEITTAGTSTAYTLTPNRTISAYYDGLVLNVKFHTACGASPTINVSSLGAKNLKRYDSTGKVAIASTDIQTSQPLMIMYDGTDFVVLGAISKFASDPTTTRADLIRRGASTIERFAPSASGDLVYYDGTDTKFGTQNAVGVLSQGLHTIWVPAGGITPRTTNGAAAGLTETTTNKVMRKTLDFDASTAEYGQVTVGMPKSWNNSTITVKFYWTATSSSGNVIWGAQGLALSDDDAMDTAFGTAQTVTDTLLSTNDMHISSATSAITIGNTPAQSDAIVLQLYRDAAAGGDTLAADALLLGVQILITLNANTDT